jgi:superfamily II DNA or RNA helicase
MQLRPYQTECREAVNAKFKQEGFKSAIVSAPTGSGKTVIFSHLAQDYPATLILAHRDELIMQAYYKVREITGLTPGIEQGPQQWEGEQICIASVASLARGRAAKFRDKIDLAIVDEAHHMAADSYLGPLSVIKPRFTVGFTATPYRGDKQKLSEFFETEAYSIHLLELIKQGFLSDIIIRKLPVQIDLRGARERGGDLDADDIGGALRDKLNELAAIVARDYKHEKCLTFCPLRSISRAWVEALAHFGVTAKHVDGDSKDRPEILEWFHDQKAAYLSNAMLLTEGYDEPSITCILNLRPTKIRGLFEQMIGRGTRIYPGKERLLLLDPIYLTDKHDLCQIGVLAAETDAQATAITRAMEVMDAAKSTAGEEKALRLTEAAVSVEAERRATMERELARASKLKASTMSIQELHRQRIAKISFTLGSSRIIDFEPVWRWHSDKPTQKQLDMLNKAGIFAEAVQSKGEAAAIIDVLVDRRRQGLATYKQISFAARLGCLNPDKMTFDGIKTWIDTRLANKRRSL